MVTPDMPKAFGLIERLEMLHLSGSVKRMHTVPTLSSHTIADHVYGSLLIGVELCRINKIEPSAVIITLLTHDAPEVDTGDIPAPVKRVSKDIGTALARLELDFENAVGYEIPDLSEMERSIVKASDTLDLMWKCVTERRMGNAHSRLALVFRNVVNYISAQWNILGVVEIVTHLKKEWTMAGGIP